MRVGVEFADVFDDPVTADGLDFLIENQLNPLTFRVWSLGATPPVVDVAGSVSWVSEPAIGWHAHLPCRHGVVASPAIELQLSVDEDPSGHPDDGQVAFRAFTERMVELVADSLAAASPAEGPAAGGDAARTTGPAETPEFDFFAGLAAGRADLGYRPGVNENGWLGAEALIGAAREAGWDIAVDEAGGRIIIIAAPGGGRCHPDVLEGPEPIKPRPGTPHFYYSRQPPDNRWPDDTCDEATFGDTVECDGGFITGYGGDIAVWHHTSPIVSAPSVAWLSVIGREVAYVEWVMDTSETLARVVQLDEPVSIPPTDRDLVLIARAMHAW